MTLCRGRAIPGHGGEKGKRRPFTVTTERDELSYAGHRTKNAKYVEQGKRSAFLVAKKRRSRGFLPAEQQKNSQLFTARPWQSLVHWLPQLDRLHLNGPMKGLHAEMAEAGRALKRETRTRE